MPQGAYGCGDECRAHICGVERNQRSDSVCKIAEELYRQVCEAAFSSGDFLTTAIFLLEPGTNTLRLTAGAGANVERLGKIHISIAATTPQGLGVSGEAFRDQRPAISNDFLNDERSLALAK